MPTIQVNPNLWTVGRVRLDNGEFLDRGDTLEVSDEEWAEKYEPQKVSQFSKRYRTFVKVGEEDAGERLAIRLENIDELTVRELRAIATDVGVSVGGTKSELVDRITAHFREEPVDDDDE